MSTTYTTIQGDEWDMIAYKVYGDEMCVDALVQANEQYNDVVIFPQGINITCPVKPQKANVILPPWKR